VKLSEQSSESFTYGPTPAPRPINSPMIIRTIANLNKGKTCLYFAGIQNPTLQFADVPFVSEPKEVNNGNRIFV